MNSKLTKISGKIVSWAGVLAPFAALTNVANAQITQIPYSPLPASPITSVGGGIGFICFLLGWAFILLIVLAVVFVLFAAFSYLTAGGDTEKVAKANKSLLFAAIAIVIGLIAKGVPSLVATLFGAGAGALNGC
jgi:hypothetical protein